MKLELASHFKTISETAIGCVQRKVAVLNERKGDSGKLEQSRKAKLELTAELARETQTQKLQSNADPTESRGSSHKGKSSKKQGKHKARDALRAESPDGFRYVNPIHEIQSGAD
eukprot:SAG11_NODE_1109_length_5830_cov_4.525388_3_plen_114_part_00